MTDTWFVVIPAVDKGKPASYLETVDFREQYQPGTSEYNAAAAGQAFNDPNLGQLVIKWKGPFATEAEAQTAQAPKQQSPNPVNDAVNAVENSTGGPLAGLQQIGTFFGSLGEANTWVRVGQVVLGLILVAVWVARITHAVPIATQVAKVAGAASI